MNSTSKPSVEGKAKVQTLEGDIVYGNPSVGKPKIDMAATLKVMLEIADDPKGFAKNQAKAHLEEVSKRNIEASKFKEVTGKNNIIGMTDSQMERFGRALAVTLGKDVSEVYAVENAVAHQRILVGDNARSVMGLALDASGSRSETAAELGQSIAWALRDPMKALEELDNIGFKLALSDEDKELIKQYSVRGDASSARRIVIDKLKGVYGARATEQVDVVNENWIEASTRWVDLKRESKINRGYTEGNYAYQSGLTILGEMDLVQKRIGHIKSKNLDELPPRIREELKRLEAYLIALNNKYENAVKEDARLVREAQENLRAEEYSKPDFSSVNTTELKESLNASCPFAGKNIEDISFKCECNCSEKKPESPVEADSSAPKSKPDATSGIPLPGGMPMGKGKGGMLASGILPMENDPTQGGSLGGFNLSEIFNGGIGDLLGNFDNLGDKASSIFKDMGMDLTSIFKDGEFAMDGLFGKLDGLFKDGPFGDILGGLFGGQGGGFDLGSLFGGGGGLGSIFSNITGGLGSMFTDMFSGGGFFDSIFSGIGSFFGGLFHGGGIVGSPVAGRMVPAALFAGAPRFHSGGWLGPGERPIIAKEGELILNAAQQKNLAGGMNGGVNVSVPVIVENHSNENVQTREESGPDGRKQIRMFIGDAVNQGIASGQFDKSMSRAYGLSRRGY